MDAEMQIQLLASRLETGLSAVAERLDAIKEAGAERHLQNIDRFGGVKQELVGLREDVKAVEKQARMTNGRVNALETVVDWLKGRARKPSESGEIDRPTLNKRDAIMVGLGGSGVIAAWKFVEWAVHLLKVQP